MQKLLSIINLKTIALGLGSMRGTILFMVCAMQFALQVTASRTQAETFPVLCSPTPIPTPMPFVGPTPDPQLCTPTPRPYPSPVEEIPIGFQNPNGAKLAWLPFRTRGPAKPAVMLIHGGNWNAGDAFDLVQVGNDISAAGYFVVSVFYELAPPNYIPDQPCHLLDGTAPGWRMAQQINDIKALVGALRTDPRCNGKVGVVGGSAGATHAVMVALDTTPSSRNGTDWPYWFQNGIDTRPDCAAMLSAIYDFSDWTPTTGDVVTDPRLVRLGLENYAQTRDLSTLASLPLNPVALVSKVGQSDLGFKPLFLINSYYDSPTAYHQIVTMSCALEAQGLMLGTDYQRLTIPNGVHSFGYWGAWDRESKNPEKTVGEDVIAFLDEHLK